MTEPGRYSEIAAHRSYTPAWWLPGAHIKTIWGRVFRKSPEIATEKILLDMPDGDILELRRLHGEGTRPRLLILHGLEGSPRSHYAKAFFAEAKERQWGADLLVFRSCGSEMNRGRRFYHSGETSDLGVAVAKILSDFPSATLLLAGVSLGGNVLLKWLGEVGSDCPPQIKAAAAISVPYDLERSSKRINSGFSRLYQRVFLRTLLVKADAIRKRHPDLLKDVDLARIRTMYDFDDKVTAPIHGFADARDYYAQSSSLKWIERVRVPTLLLSAVDDPFLPPAVLQEVLRITHQNSFLHPEFVERGGHVGFISGGNPFKPIYYAEHRVGEFLEAMASGLRREKDQIT